VLAGRAEVAVAATAASAGLLVIHLGLLLYVLRVDRRVQREER
jgi:hypothetical protein